MPISFPGWSHGYQGPVFVTGTSTTSLTLNVPSTAWVFYLYVQPLLGGEHSITVTANPGLASSASSGPIPVDGDGGAQGFGFYNMTNSSTPVYRVEITADSGAGGFAIAEFGHGLQPSSCVLTPIDLGDVVDGTWSDDCFSVYFTDHTAQYFTFSLATTTQFEIVLESSNADTFLVLRRGSGLFGQLIASNDDIDTDAPNRNSRLNNLLPPNDYTIEATNVTAGGSSFTLRLASSVEDCALDSIYLCIDDSPDDRRFQIQVEFETVQGGGAAGHGHAVPLTPLGVDRGGLIWFFRRANPELLIKVLPGCPVNGYYWVFISAGTNVGFTVTVRDTFEGFTRDYANSDLHPALPVQDVTAFPCA